MLNKIQVKYARIFMCKIGIHQRILDLLYKYFKHSFKIQYQVILHLKQKLLNNIKKKMKNLLLNVKNLH